jgi:hypothetical protein
MWSEMERPGEPGERDEEVEERRRGGGRLRDEKGRGVVGGGRGRFGGDGWTWDDEQ